MCNNAWSDLFPSCRSQYLKYEGSDHQPLLAFLDTTVIKGKGIFRFDRRLKENQEVKNLEDLEDFAYMGVQDKLAMCRKAICKWSKEFYKNNRQILNDLRNQLDQTMSNPIPDETLIAELNTDFSTLIKKKRISGDKGAGNFG